MNRPRKVHLAALVFTGITGFALAQQKPALAPSDEAAAKEARAQVDRTMNAFARMDVNAFKAGLAEDVMAFEMDLDNKPVRLGSRDDAVQYAQEMFTQLKKMGASLKLDVHAGACRAASGLASCTVEFDLMAQMADGSTMVQPSRNTIVLSKGNDGWKWIHWHSSLAVVPTPPAPPPAP